MTQLSFNLPQPVLRQNSDDNLKVSYLVADDGVDIWLHGDVGDEFEQTDSGSIGRILSQNRGRPVTLRVNSRGGLAYDGVSIYNAIDAHDAPTTGIIEGMAGSAASLAVIACQTVKCYASAVFHPHYSLMFVGGHRAEIRDALIVMERLDEDLEVVYAEASGQSIEKVKEDLMGPNGDGTRFSAEAALKAGYVDEIITHNKRKMPAARTPVAQSSENFIACRMKALELIGTDC